MINQKSFGEAVGIVNLLFSSFILLFASVGCAVLSDKLTPQPSKPTPPPELAVVYQVPSYTTTLKPGERLAGASVVYSGREGDVYQVTINGLEASKRAGDSLVWRGVIAPGVIADYRLRIAPSLLGEDLLASGSVEIYVLEPSPTELANGAQVNDGPLHFSNATLNYTIPKGGQTPGTTLVFEGVGDLGAELSGTRGYPYLVRGDSLIWTGRLRDNVTARYDLQAASVSDEQLQLVGVGDLWITPGQ